MVKQDEVRVEAHAWRSCNATSQFVVNELRGENEPEAEAEGERHCVR